MYRVEILTEHGDWVKKSLHKNLSSAEIVAEVCATSGLRVRVILAGKIIKEL